MKKTIPLICILIFVLFSIANAQSPANNAVASFPYKNMLPVLPGTKLLEADGDRSQKMLDGAHQFIEEKINASVNVRAKLWHRDFSSHAAYEQSVEGNRKTFMKYIGVEDKSEPSSAFNVGIDEKYPEPLLEKIAENNNAELVAETDAYRIYQVRWAVLNRVNGEGLLLEPKTNAIANIVALPDADQTPEQLVGLASGISRHSQFARILAENGFRVLIPVLISRSFIYPGKEEQQTYREWIYRQAFQMGRHIIGYEVQKVMSGVDWLKKNSAADIKTGVAGYSEGGLIALYAAASDKRIDAVLVSGYFSSRQKIWDEPIYRNVWGLLTEFGDAEIASLIAPRSLVIEQSSIPDLTDKVILSAPASNSEKDFPFNGYKGKLHTPPYNDVLSEYNRIDQLISPGFQQKALITGQNNLAAEFGSINALQKFVSFLGYNSSLTISNKIPHDNRVSFDPQQRQLRQLKELEDHVQWLLRDSDQKRNLFFLYHVMPQLADRTWSSKSYHPYFSPDKFIEQANNYRRIFNEEIIGKFDDSLLPANAHTRKMYDKERWTGYEVVIDVYPHVFATGILLIPKDLKQGERRPVVVCQHGRNDVPQKLIEGNENYYSNMAAKLADQGFIVYVPQNPYRGEDRYRWLSRKANSLKKTLFSFIVSQHRQTLHWLSSLPFTDSSRIAFYGLSYGGETAMRVPAILEEYCLSICSGDFGDWTRKVADTHDPHSFMHSIEWEMPYFNMGSTFSYAEMAYLIFPRPFMVERGHHDRVQPDEWVAYEYAKVKYFYDQFNCGDKTAIEFFNGGHSMKMDGTLMFLHKHLNWP